MKSKTQTRFVALPRDFAGLCKVFTPRPIRDKTDYANAVEMTDAMVVHAGDFTGDQEDYFDVLCTLIEAWEAKNVRWPKVSGLKVLKHLVEEHELSGADLARVLGASSKLGPMILRGERSITAEHARALGKHFSLPPGLFIE